MDIRGLFDDDDSMPPPCDFVPIVRQPPAATDSRMYYVECSLELRPYARTKTKLCCLRFAQNAVATMQNSADFLSRLIDDIERQRGFKSGSYGLPLKCATFCTPPQSDVVWFVFVSVESLYFSKWNTVFKGLHAEEGRMFYSTKTRLQDSLMGVPLMFPGVALQDLVSNLVQVRAQVASLRAFSSGLICFSRAPPRQNPAKRARISALEFALRREREPSPPRAEDVITEVPRAPVPAEDPADMLVAACVGFLAAPTLEGVDSHAALLQRFLVAPEMKGMLGLYLLQGRVADMFVRVRPVVFLCFP